MIRQLYYLYRSGIIRLSVKTEHKTKTETKTKAKTKTKTKTKPETKSETKTKAKPKTKSRKWKEFKERFEWVEELLDKTER